MNNDAVWTCPHEECGLVFDRFADIQDHLCTEHDEHDFVPILNGTVLWCQTEGCNARHNLDRLLPCPIHAGVGFCACPLVFMDEE